MQAAVCPHCLKSISFERNNPVCTDCGQPLDMEMLKRDNYIIDGAREAAEFSVGKDYFRNTEFLSASEHFARALAANRNSYLAQYFVLLCDIYLNEEAVGYDVMAHAIDTIKTPLALAARANVSVTDRLNFISAMLSEIKIIILNRLRSYDQTYELDSAAYRKSEIKELQTLLPLFKIDGEILMTYSPAVSGTLLEIADYAIAVCHKAVQTVAVGEELVSPSEFEYNRLVSLNNDFCFFAAALSPEYDTKKYTPDFTQNNLLADKVVSRLEKFDIKNKPYAKRYIIGDVEEYADIIAECAKTIEFTYKTCFRSLCDPNYSDRAALLKTGIELLGRILTPKVVMVDRKKVELQPDNFVDISDNCAIFTRFLREAEADYACIILRDYYSKLCDIIEMHFIPEFEKHTKVIDKIKQSRDDTKYYERFLYNAACAAAPALGTYIDFDLHKDKDRTKLVKYCKIAAEEFLMLHDYHIDEIENSNAYRPILDIYNAVMKDTEI